MFKEILRSGSFRKSKRKKSKVQWADVEGGDLAQLSFISVDDDTIELSDLETETTEKPSPTNATSPPPSPTDENSDYRPVCCSKCAKCEQMDNASFWEQSRTRQVVRRSRSRRRKQYASIGKSGDAAEAESSTPGLNSSYRRGRTKGSKLRVSAAAVLLKKIQRGPLIMCITCGPHMTQ